MNELSVVVPVAPWDLLPARLLFKSLDKYFDPQSLAMVFVFFPDKPVMEEMMDSLNLKFRYTVLNERDIIPSEDYRVFKRRKGWLRQQIVKMYVAKRIETEFYICLDSDLLCIKPTSYHDLIRNGKPGINMEPKSHHAYWWKQAQKVLKTEDSGLSSGMSSSTNIFITEEALGLIHYIEKTYNKSFTKALMNWFWTDSYIFRREWTEYKLYWLYIEWKGKTDSYDPSNKIWGKSIWKSTPVVNEELFKEVLSPENEGYFIIWQSPKVEIEEITEKVRKYLHIE